MFKWIRQNSIALFVIAIVLTLHPVRLFLDWCGVNYEERMDKFVLFIFSFVEE